MKKIVVTVGVSGSGKSTWSKEKWEMAPLSTAIVNRDKVRELLFSYTEETIKNYYNRADLNLLEKQVTKYEDVLIHEALNENKTVIIDATHLDKKYIERYKFWNVPVEIVWFDVTLKEAITRDMGRNRKVGEDIITKQYGKYISLRKDFVFNYTPTEIKLDESLPPCYLIDIDGTVAHINGKRSPYDWKSVGVDDVDLSVRPIIAAINDFAELGSPKLIKTIIVSGRDGICEPETLKWLSDNGIEHDEFYMRAQGDQRPDWQIKEEIWREIAKKYNILGLFDDRLQVVRRARALGLKVFNVEYNNF
jgi:predicted kinase